MGQDTAAVAWLQKLEREPFAADFYFTLRRFECIYDQQPRWGKALRPSDEPIRLGQDPKLAFAISPVSRLIPSASGRPARMNINVFGLLGPNGALPLHITEFIRERVSHHRDPTLARFLDMLQHRWIALFYRAWAQAQPALHLDRPKEDRFSMYVGSMIGLGSDKVKARDALPDYAKLFYAGWLMRQSRNGDGLVSLLRGYFKLPVNLEQFVGHWMKLPVSEQSRFNDSSETTALGLGTILGDRVWDRQHHVRIHIGPLNLTEYLRFLPGNQALVRLVAWMRSYLPLELSWDLRLTLARTAVPATKLGEFGQLGWTTWLDRDPRRGDADDLTLQPETDGMIAPMMAVG